MQWAMPSIQWNGPGSSETPGSKPKRLITPSTSTNRTGLPLLGFTPCEDNDEDGGLRARFRRHAVELAALLSLLVPEPGSPGSLRGHPEGRPRQRRGGGPRRGGAGGRGPMPGLPARPAAPEPRLL